MSLYVPATSSYRKGTIFSQLLPIAFDFSADLDLDLVRIAVECQVKNVMSSALEMELALYHVGYVFEDNLDKRLLVCEHLRYYDSCM